MFLTLPLKHNCIQEGRFNAKRLFCIYLRLNVYNISDENIKRGVFYITAMSTHLYARIESKVKSSKRIVDMSVLSEEELNEELEKGYADVQAGRTKNAKTTFDNIRKDYQLNT